MRPLAAALAVLLWQVAAAPQPRVAAPEYLRYERALEVPPGSGQACAALDAAIFPHAQPSLADLRIFPASAPSPSGVSSAHETPYVITVSQSATDETQSARVLNLGAARNGHVVFDLAMPQRAYSDVQLDLAAHDFVATAMVWGEAAPGGHGTALGSFTLFDLTGQRLSRDTTLPLVESTFPYLRVEVALTPAPGSRTKPADLGPAVVRSAAIPPSRSTQTVYTTVASTSSVTNTGRESRATLEVPARVPIEYIQIVLAPEFHSNFSGDVRVTATPEARQIDSRMDDPQRVSGDRLPVVTGGSEQETVSGTILRVNRTEAGREIHTDQLGFPATLGANLQGPAKVEIALENGDDQPLPIVAVELAMRQRRLCFDAGASAAPRALFYGDPALEAPVYDYERLFRAEPKPLTVRLGPEQANPGFRQRPAAPEPLTERHPETVWVALIAAVCVLGTVALRSARNLQR